MAYPVPEGGHEKAVQVKRQGGRIATPQDGGVKAPMRQRLWLVAGR
jgi:hypothetical protein